jgi:hypothetical protein
MTSARSRHPSTPRSDRYAAQSLLGHGFDVTPSTLCDIDGSLRDANFGYTTGQLPGPTPNTG